MFPGDDNGFDNDYGVNPYESFMRKHLQHYGYYTGKNQNYKNHFHQYAEWEKNYAYDLRGSTSDSDSDSDDDDDKNEDGKLQDDLLKTTQLIYSWGESGKMVPKLREPRSLYALNKELGPQQAARWPSNLQVINERVRHIQQVPSEPEPFYKTTGYEKLPMVRGESNGGRVVFSYETNASFFMKSRVGGSRNGCDQCAIPLTSDDDHTLIFESRFESGNLGKAVQVSDTEYELWLHYDLYTNKHTQWFYFRVSNTRANKEYRFTIVNFIKPDSLYNNGMRPVMYSEKEAATSKVGWVRGGENIKYYRNNLRYEVNRTERSYYSMTFTVTFKHDHDTVYFSHCYPYTYTDLQDYLLELTNDPIKSRVCRQRVLCRTLAGNLVYVLTITSASQKPEDIKHKKAVVVTSRVHPGESNASWMMKGFLDFVTGNSPDAKLLRDTFIFKVVPMLNPDGVIVGNYRCSLAGRDLNRNYKTSLKDAYPSVWHTKNMIRKLLQERDIIVYCDLHGHSRRQNVFIYGCEQKYNSNKRFHERIFPSMLNKNCPDKFCFNSCKFKVQKSKEGTGRVVMWNMGIMNSYTLEATFCGSSMGKKKGFHFNQHDYEMMGYHFCDTLLDYCDPDNTKCANIMVDLEHRHQMEVMAKIAEKGLEPEQVGDMSDSDIESSDGGSDSSVSDGPPIHLQFAASRTKKKRLKSKKERDNVRQPQKDQKDENGRKGSLQDDKRMRNNQIKPLKHDPGSKNHSIRYTSSSSPRHAKPGNDERANSGIPTFVQERVDEKNQKRHDYLEALTAAYINNNIPIVNDPALDGSRPATCPSNPIPTVDLWSGSTCSRNCLRRQQTVVHFRYSGSEKPAAAAPSHEGLCPRHEQQTLQAAMQSSGVAPDNRGATPSYPTGAQQQYEKMRARDSAFKISRLVGRKESRFTDGTGNEGLSHTASIPSLDRRHKPHLLEVSAAQQRQTDLLSKDKNGAIKTHPNPFDEKGDCTSRKSTGPKSQVPSATNYVNYNTFNVAKVKDTRPNGEPDEGQGDQGKNGSHRQRNGRKSRKGMRDDEDEDQLDSGQYQGPVFDIQGPVQPPTPRVKSAQSSSTMAATLSSIQQLQMSLQGSKPDEYAGEYIQQLIKETNEEIEGLTNEIQEDIEKKRPNHLPRDKHSDQSSNTTFAMQQKLKAYNAKKKQRSPLGLSYHGGTFVSELGSKHLDRTKQNSGHLGGKGIPATATASGPSQTPVSNNRPSLVARPGEYVPYTGSTFNSNITKFHGGPNLMVSNDGNRQRESNLVEEARTRNLKRQQSNQNVRNSVNGNQGEGTPNQKSSVTDNANGKNQPKQDKLEYTFYSAATPTTDNANNSNSGENPADIRQFSSLSGYRSNHSASSVRLSKKTLVFRNADAAGGGGGGAKVATTPRADNGHQMMDIQDGRGDGTESRSRSARSGSRQVVETVPTKISLMICKDNQESTPTQGQFKPLSRQGTRPRRKK